MSENKPIHLPGLNGIRAFAAVAVVISHTTLALNNFNLDNTVFGKDRFGNPLGLALASHAVTIFFVLSGFLITYLTIHEKQKIGNLNIRKFYIRRILRIWPLYYLYLIIIIAIILIFRLPEKNMDQLPYFLSLLLFTKYSLLQDFIQCFWEVLVQFFTFKINIIL